MLILCHTANYYLPIYLECFNHISYFYSSDNEEEEIQDDEKTVNDSGTKEFPQNLPDSKSSQKTAFELEQEIVSLKFIIRIKLSCKLIGMIN